jgi:divalent metal cation (Fe/Co/Zn/Cd) transporter
MMRNGMDRMPGEEVFAAMQRADSSVCGVLATEKVGVRKAGMTSLVTIHVQADPTLSSHHAHILTGNVEGAIQAAAPQVASVLVHMEPFEESSARFGDSGISVRAS